MSNRWFLDIATNGHLACSVFEGNVAASLVKINVYLKMRSYKAVRRCDDVNCT